MTIIEDLRPALGVARDQGRRPTCLAFATSSAHRSAIPLAEELSVEFLFHHALVAAASTPGGGASLVDVAAALKAEGQPKESAWPYQSAPSATPSVPASNCYRREMSLVAAPKIRRVRKLIKDGLPVVLGLSLTPEFYSPDSSGRVRNDSSAPATGDHAVLAVATGIDKKKQRWTLVRNSWGISWGLAGHAWLRDTYLSKRLIVMATMESV